MLGEIRDKLFERGIECYYSSMFNEISTVATEKGKVIIESYDDNEDLLVRYLNKDLILHSVWCVITDLYIVDDIVDDVCEYLQR